MATLAMVHPTICATGRQGGVLFVCFTCGIISHDAHSLVQLGDGARDVIGEGNANRPRTRFNHEGSVTLSLELCPKHCSSQDRNMPHAYQQHVADVNRTVFRAMFGANSKTYWKQRCDFEAIHNCVSYYPDQ